MHHPTDRITHTTAFVTPVMEHWLEHEITQRVHLSGPPDCVATWLMTRHHQADYNIIIVKLIPQWPFELLPLTCMLKTKVYHKNCCK